MVVTGASAGIGRAFVESVASPGTRFVLVARPDLVVANAGHSIARGVLATVERPDSVLRNAAVKELRRELGSAATPRSIKVAGP